MDITSGTRLRTGILMLLFSALFYGTSFVKLPAIDSVADDYFSESIKAAGIAYATTRGVNAVVSVVKESQLELAPAGVGVTIAAGQMLDPIDDMTERLSTMLVAAIASLGIQKLGYEIGEAVSFKAIAILLLLAIPLLWHTDDSGKSPLLPLLFKLCLMLLLLRFMLPASALVSDALYTDWLKPDIEASMQRLTIVANSYEELSSMPPEKSGSFFTSMTESASEKVENTRKAFLNMVENAEAIISSLLRLMTAYLAIFVLQVLLLPLVMLWLLAKTFSSRTVGDTMKQMVARYTGA